MDRPKGGQRRGRIGPDDVKEAAAAAKTAVPGDDAIHDLNDTELPYLTLRRRGKKVSWLVRAFKKTKVIGTPVGIHVDPSYLTLAAARQKAQRVYVELGEAKTEEPPTPALPPPPLSWSVSQLCLGYTAYMSGGRWLNERTRPASPSTVNDIRQAFSHEAVQVLGPMLLIDLDRETVERVRDAIEPKIAGAGVHRAKRKFIVWFKAAMVWAAKKHPFQSGLKDGRDRWWERLTVADPSADEQKAIKARRKLRLLRKSELTVAEIGKVLAAHEQYCAGRTGRDMVGPGVRFGVWWTNFTANRRYTTVKLERNNFKEQDPHNAPGWGRAMWEEDQMKAKEVFWLPLPPVVRDIATFAMTDWKQLVKNEHGDLDSKWVFASTRRTGRDPGNEDVSTYPSALNEHIGKLRAAGVLQDVKYYSLHLARAAMTAFLEKAVSPRAASVTLAHALDDKEQSGMSDVTREFYSVDQLMEEKTVAMKAWSDALIEAFLNAGGTMPAPSVQRRATKLKTKKTPE
ncbi:hypothetical protein [Bradyrhizobium betae]|uniref:Tyr recombinase domain-containing protein n=1 Tax=Bradyrhizobium betae TaxID=244734 RepID=A0A5P6P941_9BRAD|nr:hypothetical protein [Bradyrhizobium betae]MCS3727238.1 hypothetical protein [Bradyrhizobium betae]QFI74850.1 hypothetical protein F8237_22040 [Bradyrhizobium betae]